MKYMDTADCLNSKIVKLRNNFCENPFTYIAIAPNGDCLLCCKAFLPTVIGNLFEQDLDNIFNSQAAQEIRASILDGSFKYCKHNICGAIQSGNLQERNQITSKSLRRIIDNGITHVLQGPSTVAANYDKSCNLSCPSCRPNTVHIYEGEKYNRIKSLQDKLFTQLFAHSKNKQVRMIITGNGDCFGSKIFRDFLFNLDGKDYPNLEFTLRTNGVLFSEKYWNKIERIHDNISTISISVDAVRSETYASVRRGGEWNVLHKNISFLAAKRKEGKFKRLVLNCVVQGANFRELTELIGLAIYLDVSALKFSLINSRDWYTDEYWRKAAVWKTIHPEFDEFIKVLEDPIFDHPIVQMGNLTAYRKLALEKRDNL